MIIIGISGKTGGGNNWESRDARNVPFIDLDVHRDLENSKNLFAPYT